MATVIDELITKFTLEAGPYIHGAQEVLKKTEQVSRVLDGLGHRIKDKFGGALGSLGAMAGGFGLVEIVKHSTEAAIQFDFLSRSLEAVVHSGERAHKVMDFVEKLAIPSRFTVEPLAQAAERLEAFGLNTEKYLPAVEKLATVFGHGEDSLNQYAEAMGRIKAGSIGRGLLELRAAGISNDDLKRKGVNIGNTGEVEGGPAASGKVLAAVLDLVEEKYGNLSKTVGGSFEAKLASLKDEGERAFRALGNAILTGVMPFALQMSKWLEDVNDSGQMNRIAKNWVSLFSVDTSGATGAMEKLGNLLENLPSRIKVVEAFFVGAVTNIVKNLKIAAAVGAAIWTVANTQMIMTGVAQAVNAFIALRSAISAAGIASVFMQVVMNPAALITVGLAVTAATAAYFALDGVINSVKASFDGLTTAGATGSEKLGKLQAHLAELKQRYSDLADQMERAKQAGDVSRVSELRVEYDKLGKSIQDAGTRLEAFQARQEILENNKGIDAINKKQIDIANEENGWRRMAAAAYRAGGEEDADNKKRQELEDKNEELTKKVKSASKLKGEIPTTGGSTGGLASGVASEATTYLQQIAQNTKQQLDVSRHAFGGGDLGRTGVSPVELAGHVASHGGGRLGTVIADAVTSEINRIIQDAMRNRYVTGRGR